MTSRRQTSAPLIDGDARAIVPVKDDIGGVVVYVSGQPAYYVLNGEWFRAVSTRRVADDLGVPRRIDTDDSHPDFAYSKPL